MGFIYKHTNKINGKVYIGQTIRSPKSRWANGTGYTNDKRKLTSPFANAIIKYGWDNFEHEILCECENERLDELERYYISFYKSNIKTFGYNCENGGNKNKKISKETREKLSKSHKGKGHPCSEETRRKLSIARTGKGNPMYGVKGKRHPNFGTHRPMPEHVKVILKKANARRVRTDEEKKKISEALKGRKLSEVLKLKLSEAHKGKSNEAIKRPVVMLSLDGSFLKEFDSLKAVKNHFGVKSVSHISSVCKGKREQTLGYKWMYKEDYYNANTRS